MDSPKVVKAILNTKSQFFFQVFYTSTNFVCKKRRKWGMESESEREIKSTSRKKVKKHKNN